jgi:hypothetical protein
MFNVQHVSYEVHIYRHSLIYATFVSSDPPPHKLKMLKPYKNKKRLYKRFPYPLESDNNKSGEEAASPGQIFPASNNIRHYSITA